LSQASISRWQFRSLPALSAEVLFFLSLIGREYRLPSGAFGFQAI
jgi:hypothetical protein